MKKRYAALLALAAIFRSSQPASATLALPDERVQALRIVAMTNQQAPSLPAGVVFRNRNGGSGLFTPVINDQGQVAFQARLAGTGITDANENSIWAERGATLTLIARQEDAAFPPSASPMLEFPASPLFNGAGDLVFPFTMTGSGVMLSNNLGLWFVHGGQRSLIAREGAPAPGAPAGSTFLGESDLRNSVVLNGAGDVAFYSMLQVPGSPTSFNPGLWVTRAGATVNLAYAGSEAEAVGPGVTFNSFSYPSLNGHGAVAFGASFQGAGVTSENDESIWKNDGANNVLVAREDQLAGIDATTRFGFFTSDATINARGDIVFGNSLKNAPLTQDDSLWMWSNGQLRLSAREGSPAVGAPAGVTLGDNGFQFPVLNDASDIAYSGPLNGAASTGVTQLNNSAIWIDHGGQTEMVIREGDQIPDLPVGTTLGNVFAQQLLLNGAGQLAFLADIRNPDGTNGRAVLGTTTGGLLRTLLRTGDMVDAGANGPQPVLTMELSDDAGNGDGSPSSLNNLGQVSIYYTVGGGNFGGIAVSNLIAVPEPRTLLCSLAMVVLLHGTGGRGPRPARNEPGL